MSAPSQSLSITAVHNDRYKVERWLGEGGSGAVFLVRDAETGEQLALKKLLYVDAKSVLRLKREFRAMQAVNHPHIIKLYDMAQAEDSWFLTMEYLDGLDFAAYLRREQPSSQQDAPQRLAPRTIAAFRQLARGVHALHEVGMLHRDLKPSNVIVVDHRVVVLDFGLVCQLSSDDNTLTEEGRIAGTPAYMAPEQLMAKELSAATDWYAFGVMLYEAVSGERPFDGSLLELLRCKVELDAIPLAELAPLAPAWICKLCTGLLQRDPLERPSGAEIIGWFNAADPAAAQTVTQTEHVTQTETEYREADSQLFGREREVEQLWSAYQRAQRGRWAVAHVRAASGAGKSALVEHFVAALQTQPDTPAKSLVLRSRCYELEAMPFKALDGLMDELVRHLLRIDDLEVAHLLPNDLAALVQVFPVLERVHAVKRLAGRSRVGADAIQTRHRAENAFRTLLENVASHLPLVLWIDDLQWGDVDSAQILRRWFLQPSAASILFVFSYRSDEIATSSCLQKLLGADAEHGPLEIEDAIDLAPLPDADLVAMCARRLRFQGEQRAEFIEQIAREAQGSPFLASQLLALADAKIARGDASAAGLSLDLMVAQTSTLLGADAQRLLDVLAVAGRPMLPKLALQAAAISAGGRAAVHDLRTLNLVRTRDVSGARMLEVYHDRIRERVRGAISAADARNLQAELFRVLELHGHADPDWLHALALGAGQTALALQYGKQAAARANASMAFDRAARLYRACLELDPHGSAALWGELSTVLARSGRGVAAAEAALEAAKHVSPAEAGAWTQRAALHYLRSGHYREGNALVCKVLTAADMHIPTSDAGLLAAIVWERARIKLLGPAKVASAATFAPEALQRIDLLLSLSASLQSWDQLRGLLFQLRALRLALEVGEPRRLVRVLCSASTVLAHAGTPQTAQQSDALFARAAAIDAAQPSSDACALASTRALNGFLLGRFEDVLRDAEDAERLFRTDAQDDPVGNYHRRTSTAVVRLGMLHLSAQYKRFSEETSAVTAEALATDNRVIQLQLAYTQTIAEQFSGFAAKCRPRLDAQRAFLPPERMSYLHMLHLAAVMSTACWTRDYAWAHELLADMWPRFLRLPLRGPAAVAFMAHETHARLLLNQCVEEKGDGDFSALIAKDLRVLEKIALQVSPVTVLRFRARLAALRGDTSAAVAQLRQNLVLLEQFMPGPHELAHERYALGAMLGGAEGDSMCDEARAAIAALGVVDVDGDLRAVFPEAVRRQHGRL